VATLATHRSLGAAQAAAVEELIMTPKAMESRVTAAQPGPAATERLLLRPGWPSGWDAGMPGASPACAGNQPSLQAKLEFALS